MSLFIRIVAIYLCLHLSIGLVNIVRCEYALAKEEEYEQKVNLQRYYREQDKFSFKKLCPIPGYGITWETVDVTDEKELSDEIKRRYATSRANPSYRSAVPSSRIDDDEELIEFRPTYGLDRVEAEQ